MDVLLLSLSRLCIMWQAILQRGLAHARMYVAVHSSYSRTLTHCGGVRVARVRVQYVLRAAQLDLVIPRLVIPRARARARSTAHSG